LRKSFPSGVGGSAEFLRRMDAVEAGTATLIDRPEFRRRMRERLDEL
jgi:hypothetical protein